MIGHPGSVGAILPRPVRSTVRIGSVQSLYSAHPFAFIEHQIELALIFRGAEIDLIQRNTGTVQIAQRAQSTHRTIASQRMIDPDGILPIRLVGTVFHLAPVWV